MIHSRWIAIHQPAEQSLAPLSCGLVSLFCYQFTIYISIKLVQPFLYHFLKFKEMHSMFDGLCVCVCVGGLSVCQLRIVPISLIIATYPFLSSCFLLKETLFHSFLHAEHPKLFRTNGFDVIFNIKKAEEYKIKAIPYLNIWRNRQLQRLSEFERTWFWFHVH